MNDLRRRLPRDGSNASLEVPMSPRKDCTLWRRFMLPLPKLLEGFFLSLLMVH